jgi:hypothetical protein
MEITPLLIIECVLGLTIASIVLAMLFGVIEDE